MQVRLAQDQAQRLRAIARIRGVSMAEMIRRSVEAMLCAEAGRRAEIERRAIAASGQFRSDVSGAAVNHDLYLAEAYAQVGD